MVVGMIKWLTLVGLWVKGFGRGERAVVGTKTHMVDDKFTNCISTGCCNGGVSDCHGLLVKTYGA